jgi:hypothetical protein
MFGNAKTWFAAAAMFGLAVCLFGGNVRSSAAGAAEPVDLAELKDAITTASKRGANLDEVTKALAALDKLLAAGWKKPEAKADAPKELIALRQAVEAAGRKGENVEEIARQLEAVEMNLLGRALTAPKPVPPPLGEIPREQPPPRRVPNDFPFPRVEFPPRALPNPGVDPDALQRALEQRMKAMEMLLKDRNDEKALELAKQANEMLLKAMLAGQRDIFPPELMFPNLDARVPDRFRLGIRMEKIAPIVVEQLGIEAGRGIAVSDVIAGSAAEKAGFKANDIVLEFAGKPVSDIPEEFNRQVMAVKAGEKVSATVLRKGKKVELTGIVLPEAARPAPIRPVPIERLRPGIDRALPLLPDRGPIPGVFPGDAFPILPDVRPLPGFPNPFGDRNGRAGSMSVTLENGAFTIKADQDGVGYQLKGSIQPGEEPKLAEIVIDADGKSTKVESIDKVPAEHRPTVEKLLKSVASRPAVRRPKD